MTLIDEFNCNHQADIESNDQMEIFGREKELEKIKGFLNETISRKKSGLMYLCGHPGTGKTSSLNSVLSQMKGNFKPLLFNAMTYPDVKSFALVLYEQLHEEFLGEPPKRRLTRQQVDDEELSFIIERLLSKISEKHKFTGGQELPHRIIVIDEVDCFSSNEKAFTLLIK